MATHLNLNTHGLMGHQNSRSTQHNQVRDGQTQRLFIFDKPFKSHPKKLLFSAASTTKHDNLLTITGHQLATHSQTETPTWYDHSPFTSPSLAVEPCTSELEALQQQPSAIGRQELSAFRAASATLHLAKTQTAQSR
jgi:hypothetical protein